jgi:hypothetical protein
MPANPTYPRCHAGYAENQTYIFDRPHDLSPAHPIGPSSFAVAG